MGHRITLSEDGMHQKTLAPPCLFDHSDQLAFLGEAHSLDEKLTFLHHYLRESVASVDRMAVALYDPATDILKTYAHSSLGDNPLPLYEARLAQSRTLSEIVARRQPRIINDIEQVTATQTHTQRIQRQGYGSSYTLPIYRNGTFLGFLFFNSYRKHAFGEKVLHLLDLVGHLLALFIIDHLTTARNLVASVRTISTLAQHRDPETGGHLERMSHYSRLIARTIAPQFGLDDLAVEHIFLFSPLHDIGKIAIPDSILCKPAKLTDEEFSVMKRHPEEGAKMIDAILEHFDLLKMPQADLLRNIALYHHEAMNGEGYPHGLRGDAIPVEARIAAVADVFDALTSVRPYKHAWSNDEAFALLARLAGDRLDYDCVMALIEQRTEVEQIQDRFAEDRLG
ncbi:MAG: response regulator containing a CheY-like receiver domain and an domain [Rhodocyclaceae bacterium]|nr:response regulator containing a CheY-like receiver domain and an domain [Rhodocyclaceae bacterium]